MSAVRQCSKRFVLFHRKEVQNRAGDRRSHAGIVSSLQVYLRDSAQVLGVALTFWFWTTPIFIDESHYPHRLRFLLRANPFAYFVRGYRDSLLSFRWPDPADLLIVAAYSIAAFVAGGLVFRHLKRGFADVL